jgi:hypothetical protein
MNFSGLGIATAATLVSFGFIMVDYSFHHYATPFFLSFWMAIYFLYAMAVMLCAEVAFQITTVRWWSPAKTVRYSKLIGSWAVTALVPWFAFSHQHVFLWVVFALTLVVVFWIRFSGDFTA